MLAWGGNGIANVMFSGVGCAVEGFPVSSVGVEVEGCSSVACLAAAAAAKVVEGVASSAVVVGLNEGAADGDELGVKVGGAPVGLVVVGAPVGADVGQFVVGELDGEAVGLVVVGDTVGTTDGIPEGEVLGDAEGAREGLGEGAPVGLVVVGALEGADVGPLVVGELDGEAVGLVLGDKLGAAVGSRQLTFVFPGTNMVAGHPHAENAYAPRLERHSGIRKVVSFVHPAKL